MDAHNSQSNSDGAPPMVESTAPELDESRSSAEPRDDPFIVPGNIGDDALADLIDRDVADRLVQGLPVKLARYLEVITDIKGVGGTGNIAGTGNAGQRPLAIDAAVDGALRARTAAGLEIAAAVNELAQDHPELRRVIESTATISMLFGPSGSAIEEAEPARERSLPSRFGRPLPDGLGRYELLEALGPRRPPRVFRAIDHLLGRAGQRIEVVVKILGKAGDQTQLDEAIEEARLLRSLRHEAIVGLVDSGVSDDAEVYLVTELVLGESLREHIERHDHHGRPTAIDAARLMSTLAHAVGLAHRTGVIHCDLSPSNLLVDSEGHPRIVDLGSAVRVGATAPAPRAMRGTPGFMAPEQVDPSGVARPTLDVYALGAVLFWVLTGVSANGRDSAEIDALLRGRVNPRPWRSEALLAAGVPRGLSRIALQAIEIDPSRRPPDADSLARRLDSWIEEHARSLLPWPDRAVGWARRRPRLALLLTVGITAVATLLVVTSLMRFGDEPRRGAEYSLMAARVDRSLAYGMNRYDRSLRVERDEARALLGRVPQIMGTSRAPAETLLEWMSGSEAARLSSLLAGLQIIAGRHDESSRVEALTLRVSLAALALAQNRDPTPILRGGGVDLEVLLSPGDPLRAIGVGVQRAATAGAVADGLQRGRSRPGLPAPENALVELDASIRENVAAQRTVIVHLLKERRDRLAAAMAGRPSRPGASVESPGGAVEPPPN